MSPFLLRDFFGYPLAVAGQTIYAGATSDDTAGFEAGAAYQIDSQTGAVLHTYFAPNSSFNDQFPRAIAEVNGSVFLSLDYTADGGGGKVFQFDVDSGDLIRTINNPDPHSADRFGASVTKIGNTLLVGSPQYAYLVPEPPSLALAAVAFFGLVGCVRRSRKR